MIKSLYTGATGMRAQQKNVDVTANNLANINTNGFKRDRANFEDLYYHYSKSPGAPSAEATEHPSGIYVGMGVQTGSTSKVYTQGNVEKTDNPLDITIKGDGFFQVLNPDGSISYTRDGSFQLDGQGNIVTSSGLYLEPQIRVPEEATDVTIRKDGTVSVEMPGQTDPRQIGQIELARFVNPGGLRSQGSNLLRETPASGRPRVVTPGRDGSGQLIQNYLESSNVDVIQSLTDLIAQQRAYEFNHRTIRTSDQMLQRAATLLQ